MTDAPMPPPPPKPIPESIAHGPAPSPPPARRPWSLGEKIAWVVIALAVALVLAQPVIFRPSAAGRELAAEKAPDFQLLLQARYIVGVNALLPLRAAGQTNALLATLTGAAKAPADKLRAAIIRAELQDKDGALAELDRLAVNHPDLAPDVETLHAIYRGDISPESERWRDFRARHGWFADLALSYGKPETDPLRAATLRAAMRTVVVLIGGLIVALGLAAAGLGLLIWAAIFFFSRRLRPLFAGNRALPADRSSYVQGFAFFLMILACAGLILRAILWLLPGKPSAGLWSVLILPFAFLAGALWPLLRGQSWRGWCAATGLHAGRGIFREIIAGAAGYVAGLPILGVGILLTLVLTKISGLDTTHPIVKELMGSPVRIALIFVLASIYAPITEELMFRGSLFAHLRERFGFWVSALTVALVFAIIHPQGWPALPALGSLALVFAGVREWRGSIVGCMAAHAINNTLALILVVLMIS